MKERDQEAQDAASRAPDAPPLSPLPDLAHSRDPYRALRYRDFRLLIIGLFIAVVGEQMVGVAIGWELYDRTQSALVLGVVGLVQGLPVLLLALPAGHLADRLNRRSIILGGKIVLALGSLGLALLSFKHGPLWMIYACLLGMGGATAFVNPASTAFLSQVVPEALFENAATWQDSAWYVASILGPGVGGLLIAALHGSWPIYLLNSGMILIFLLLLFQLRVPTRIISNLKPQTLLRSLGEGLRFLGKTQILLAAITLDLFSVLFGGATTLLPVFARDILHVGPDGLGWLRAAPAIGAIFAALWIAHIPTFRRAGQTLLLAVAGFGVATILFGISHWFWLSLVMLLLLGGFDSISGIIRGTLLLTRTPDELRGRVSSVEIIFVSTSNELGGFESGLVAQFLGPMFAVVGGGIGTLIVVLCVFLCWPELRRLGPLSETTTHSHETTS